MLLHLSVRDLATLAHVELDLPAGLVVLTGETGAGKSMLVESLRFALGERARGDLLRQGAERAEVVAVFEIPPGHEVLHILQEAELEDPDEPSRIVLRRVLRSGGRSLLQVNGTPVPLRTLGPIRNLLVDLTGQHAHVRLLDPEHHRDLLDDLPSVRPHRERYGGAHASWRDAASELDALLARTRERAERRDHLELLLEECERVAPEPDEEPRLESEWRRMVHAEEIGQAAARLHDLLDGDGASAEARLASGATVLRELGRVDPEAAAGFGSRLEDLQDRVQELARDVRAHGEGIEVSPGVRAEAEARLGDLRRLRRRFGCTPDELDARIAAARQELVEIGNLDERGDEARARVSDLRADLQEAGLALRGARRDAIPILLDAVHQHLARLQMPRCRLTIDLEPLDPPRGHGLDAIRLRARTNPGEGFRPLETVASGGELSRLLLAIKAAAREGDRVLTTVFDEVDAGIGGEAALAAGALLAELSQGRQVLCVSHMPQIAAAASHHIHVRKRVQQGRTFTHLEVVGGDARLDILGRMLGGDASSAARTHAEELLKRAGS